MVLTWNVNTDKYHYFDLYEMSSSLISLQLLKNKADNKVNSNTLMVKDVTCCHFNNVNDLDIETAKRIMIEKFLAYVDFLANDPESLLLPAEEITGNINDFSETFIQYKVKQHLDCNPDKAECACQIVDNPLASDESRV